MNISMQFFAQIRRATGTESDQLELDSGADTLALLKTAAHRYGPDFSALVVDENGSLRPSVILLVNGLPAPRDGSHILQDGDQVSLLSAVAGG